MLNPARLRPGVPFLGARNKRVVSHVFCHSGSVLTGCKSFSWYLDITIENA